MLPDRPDRSPAPALVCRAARCSMVAGARKDTKNEKWASGRPEQEMSGCGEEMVRKDVRSEARRC